eukprot:3717600-Lingulodinium_polyedra.AAC.1
MSWWLTCWLVRTWGPSVLWSLPWGLWEIPYANNWAWILGHLLPWACTGMGFTIRNARALRCSAGIPWAKAGRNGSQWLWWRKPFAVGAGARGDTHWSPCWRSFAGPSSAWLQ